MSGVACDVDFRVGTAGSGGPAASAARKRIGPGLTRRTPGFASAWPAGVLGIAPADCPPERPRAVATDDNLKTDRSRIGVDLIEGHMPARVGRL